MRVTRLERSCRQAAPRAGELFGMTDRSSHSSDVFRRHIVINIHHWIRRQLVGMARDLGLQSGDQTCSAISECAIRYLEVIHCLIETNAIKPWLPFRTSVSGAAVSPPRRSARIGVFPTAGNPLHWGHLLCGLAAIAFLKLDKVVYVIAGSDRRKPHLMPEGFRHSMAKEVLSGFSPLFAYSPIARGSTRDGETSLFRILDLNPELEIQPVYLAGSDHCHRFSPATEEPDTLEKLERNFAVHAAGPIAGACRPLVAFFERGSVGPVPETALDITVLPGPPINTSSTAIRDALHGRRGTGCLAALPHATYRRLHGVVNNAPRLRPGTSPASDDSRSMYAAATATTKHGRQG